MTDTRDAVIFETTWLADKLDSEYEERGHQEGLILQVLLIEN